MNQIFTYPGQPEMQAEVILASKTDTGAPPIVTMRVRYPRIIHAEVMTHRVFSRNARSSRAVPIKTMLAEILNNPFVPWHWGKNQKGMQADEECKARVSYRHLDMFEFTDRHSAWLHARDAAVNIAQGFDEAGYHKQIVNRLLEPFMWIDVLITATNWDNFFWLRDHKDAEPHIADLSRLMKQAYDAADFQILEAGKWHLPYITREDRIAVHNMTPDYSEQNLLLSKFSSSRCARISYKPFDGDASYERELDRYYSLVSSDRVHASPLEHQATPDVKGYWADSGAFIHESDGDWDRSDLHANFTGWIQYRKTVPGECHS